MAANSGAQRGKFDYHERLQWEREEREKAGYPEPEKKVRVQEMPFVNAIVPRVAYETNSPLVVNTPLFSSLAAVRELEI